MRAGGSASAGNRVGGLARLAVPIIVVVTLVGCRSGIGRDPNRARATIEAYETRVSGLERDVRAGRSTIAALTPPATPTPIPFAKRWEIGVSGRVELRRRVGVSDGLTPVAANGVFLVVPISVMNRGDVPATFNPVGVLEVTDRRGRHYDVDPRATGAAYVLDFGLDPSFAPRQPDIEYRDVLVFDVPTDAGGFALTAADGSFQAALNPVPATPAA